MTVQQTNPENPNSGPDRDQPEFISVRSLLILVTAVLIIVATVVWPLVGVGLLTLVGLIATLNSLVGR